MEEEGLPQINRCPPRAGPLVVPDKTEAVVPLSLIPITNRQQCMRWTRHGRPHWHICMQPIETATVHMRTIHPYLIK